MTKYSKLTENRTEIFSIISTS